LLNGESASCPNQYLTRGGIGEYRRKPLERLNLSGNNINKKTLKILSMFNSLKVLILVGCQINGEGIIELLGGPNNSAHRQRSSWRELYLASNTIGDIGALALAQSMKEQRLPLLKILNMESNVISVEAFRVFVEDGLVHSRRLESVQLWNDGAITSNQQNNWNEFEQIMQHYLLLNQAGRFTLFADGNYDIEDAENNEIRINNNGDNKRSNSINNNKKISSNLWPFILEDADSIYGEDALFYFLHKRPDLIISSQQPQTSNLYQSTPLNKSAPQASSPKGVADIASFQS